MSKFYHDPKQAAAGMLEVRTRAEALARCDRYISGAIRSEIPPDFWQAVRDEIAEAGES